MRATLILSTLFGSSFVSATLLPGNSELVLVGFLTTTAVSPFLLLCVAIMGNTLGGLTNVVIGRRIKAPKQQKGCELASSWLRRYGSAALLLSWLPIIGDLLCVLAGWLRLSWWSVSVFMFIGKSIRYMVIMWITLESITYIG